MPQINQHGFAWFEGRILPLDEARVPLSTHALHYGSGCFEGIRAYYNQKQQQLFVMKMREHYERIQRSCRILRIDPGMTVDEMCETTLDLLRHADFRENLYIRPIAYKAGFALGLGLTGIPDAFAVYVVPLTAYHARAAEGLHLCVSSWVRPEDNALPVRAKVTGAYVNSCLAADDAHRNGFDDAIMLTADGHVSEATSCNLFIVRQGQIATPPVSDAILEGVTRHTVMTLAKELGYEAVERKIDRTELYVADEVFVVGTAVEVAPVTSIDHRPIGLGTIGPITEHIRSTYFKAVRGEDEAYLDWLTPAYV